MTVPANLLQRAWEILEDFTLDVEAIGVDRVKYDTQFGPDDDEPGWPDLVVTYEKAVKLLKEA